ncbi:hypothetical protein P8452_58714 [Trifolium repens]|nr:hypothetical protein P8452_58714 [Trifolium repens]
MISRQSFTVVEFVAARVMMIVQIIFVVFRKLESVFLIIVIAINRERGTTQDKPLVQIQLLKRRILASSTVACVTAASFMMIVQIMNVSTKILLRSALLIYVTVKHLRERRTT